MSSRCTDLTVQGVAAIEDIPPKHDDVIKWKHFPRYWPFMRGIHRSTVYSPHKGQWRRALMFSLICGRINGWVNNGEDGDLRRHRSHNVVIVMIHVERKYGSHITPFEVEVPNEWFWILHRERTTVSLPYLVKHFETTVQLRNIKS